MKPISELRRDHRLHVLEYGDDGLAGFFRSLSTRPLKVIASSGGGWDHVSVSTPIGSPVPTYYEMQAVAQAFFLPHETAMQLHVPADDHVNNHPNCLHWWRPNCGNQAIPIPPREFV